MCVKPRISHPKAPALGPHQPKRFALEGSPRPRVGNDQKAAVWKGGAGWGVRPPEASPEIKPSHACQQRKNRSSSTGGLYSTLLHTPL
jgi:hypothetical protein